MSKYGTLVCKECKVSLWLGKSVRASEDSDKISYFIRGSEPSNSRNETLNRALWKMLAEHARHPLRVVIEGDDDYEESAEYAEIGGDLPNSIPFKEFLKDWKG
jgi:hypothetical protein